MCGTYSARESCSVRLKSSFRTVKGPEGPQELKEWSFHWGLLPRWHLSPALRLPFLPSHTLLFLFLLSFAHDIHWVPQSHGYSVSPFLDTLTQVVGSSCPKVYFSRLLCLSEGNNAPRIHVTQGQ